MFIGEYLHTIDEKRRLAIPSKFRKDLGKKAVVTRGLENCLVVYPMDEWEKLAEKLSSLPTSKEEARSFTRLMLAGAMDVSLDNLGRILIPDYLKKYAVLKKNICIIGLANRIEIWNQKTWETYKSKAETKVEAIAEKLEELGI